MKLFLTFLLAFAASSRAFELIPPKNDWVKTGDSQELMCESSEIISSCSWDTPYGSNYPLKEGLTAESGRIEYFSANDNQCGIKITRVEAKDDGIWACNVGIVDSGEVTSAKGQSRLNIAQKPKSVMLMEPYNAKSANLTATEVQVKCVVQDAMPEPMFSWTIGNDLLENAETNKERDGQTWIETLTYYPLPDHHNQTLVCTVNHIGFEEGDEDQASTTIFFSQLDLPTTMKKVFDPTKFGFVILIAVVCGLILVGPCIIFQLIRKHIGMPYIPGGAKDTSATESTKAEVEAKDVEADEGAKTEEPTNNEDLETNDEAQPAKITACGRFAALFRKESKDCDVEAALEKREEKDAEEEDVVEDNKEVAAPTDKTDEETEATEEVVEKKKASLLNCCVKAEDEDKEVPKDAEEKVAKKKIFDCLKFSRSEKIPTVESLEAGKEKAANEEDGEKEPEEPKMKELEPEDKPEVEEKNVPSPRNTPV